jgi:hypothetical protein
MAPYLGPGGPEQGGHHPPPHSAAFQRPPQGYYGAPGKWEWSRAMCACHVHQVRGKESVGVPAAGVNVNAAFGAGPLFFTLSAAPAPPAPHRSLRTPFNIFALV